MALDEDSVFIKECEEDKNDLLQMLSADIQKFPYGVNQAAAVTSCRAASQLLVSLIVNAAGVYGEWAGKEIWQIVSNELAAYPQVFEWAKAEGMLKPKP